MSEEENRVWINSAPDENGHYHLVLEMDEDDVIPLTAETAYGWCREVLSAVAAAEYDAAVLNQMKTLGMDMQAVKLVLQEIRADRADHVPASMIPDLSMTPGVSAFTGKGFIALSRRGKVVGQWDMADARRHVLGLMTAVEVLPLDGAYLRALVSKFGIERERAMNVIADLGNFREPE